MNWTLQHGATTQSLAAWGLCAPMVEFTSQAPDVLTLAHDGAAMDAEPLFNYGDALTLRRDGVVVFAGVVTQPQRQGGPDAEGMTYEVSGPWWLFGQGNFEQNIATWNGTTLTYQNSTRVSLFTNSIVGLGNDKISLAAQIIQIVNVCNAYHGGGNFQLGTLAGQGFAISPPPRDLTDCTFEGALKECLRWIPDAVCAWDYTTEPPTLHITPRGAATGQSLALTGGALVTPGIKPRHDLQLRGVRLTYVSQDATGATTSSGDSAGETTGTRILRATMTLQGETFTPAVKQVATLKSKLVQESSAAWWATSGAIEVKDAADIIVGNGSSIELDNDAPENAEFNGLAGCTRQILKGAPPPWLGDDHFRVALVTGYLTLRIWNDPNDHSKGRKQNEKRIVKISLPCTDLSGSSFERVVTPEMIKPGESPPSGLAAALLAALSVLQWQGGLTLEQDECAQTFKPGMLLNITGGLAAWATMAAQIQTVQWDMEAGRTTLTFGPAEHLGPADFVELGRNVNRNPPALPLSQREGGTNDESEIDHPAAPVAIRSVETVPDASTSDNEGSEWKYERNLNAGGLWNIKHKTDGREVNLDPSELDADEKAQWRTVSICEDGVTKTAKVLMTETQAPP